MSDSTKQLRLGESQIAAFNTDRNAVEQASRFLAFAQAMGGLSQSGVVVDMGGGNGYFARELHEASGSRVRVIDSDEKSIRGCRSLGINGVEAVCGDAVNPDFIR
jgi:predicted RNA methylase